jgi:hypothetical protein
MHITEYGETLVNDKGRGGADMRYRVGSIKPASLSISCPTYCVAFDLIVFIT